MHRVIKVPLSQEIIKIFHNSPYSKKYRRPQRGSQKP